MKRLIFILLLLGMLLTSCGGDKNSTDITNTPTSTGQPATDVQDALTAAQNAIDAGDYNEAIKQYEAAIAANPSLEAYFGLGNAYTRLGNLEEAEKAYQQALAINPNHAATLSNLGVVYYQRGDLSQAKASFEKALQASPDDAATHYLLGATHLQLGDSTAAEASFRKALEIDPTLPEAHFGMGMLYRMRGDTANAIAEFETFLSGPPAQDPRAKSEAEKILQELKAQ